MAINLEIFVVLSEATYRLCFLVPYAAPPEFFFLFLSIIVVSVAL